jgi:hypothetical protein
MQLPERLRNLGIVPYNPNEKVKVTLSESKMKSMEEIFIPLLDKKEGA